MLISDLILGKPNPWKDVYDPSRKTLHTAIDYITENVNVVEQYSAWVKKGDIETPDELLPGQGGVLKEGLKPIAVYRDESGKIHRSSAVCVHMGCIVQWNDEEKSFDCPCHGSRFTYDGQVINGPANKNLNQVQTEASRSHASAPGGLKK
jgi:Rieske Fe-S protein